MFNIDIKIQKHFRTGTTWLSLIYILIALLVVVTSMYVSKQQELNLSARGLYSEHSIFFIFNEKEKEVNPDWRNLKTNESYTVFREMDTIGAAIIRGYFFQNESYKPRMIKGTFFTVNDFYRNEKKAVVGKKIYKSQLSSYQGKEYYTYNEVKFEIIGVMGEHYETKLDNIILLNMDALNQFNDKPSIYVLDQEKGAQESISNNKLYSNDHHFPIQLIDIGGIGVNYFAANPNYDMIVFVMLLLLCSSILFTYNWLRIKRNEIKILRIHGIDSKFFYIRNLIVYYFIALCSYVFMSILCISVMVWSDGDVKAFYEYFTLGTVFTFVIAVLSYTISKKIVSSQFKKKKGFL